MDWNDWGIWNSHESQPRKIIMDSMQRRPMLNIPIKKKKRQMVSTEKKLGENQIFQADFTQRKHRSQR